jgi:hypothetical protein
MKKMLLLAVLLSANVFAQERATLTTPKVLTTTVYRLSTLVLDWDSPSVVITLKSTTVADDTKVCSYTGATATTMMIALNKANLTTRSLNQRIFDRLITDACLVGTVTGTVP